ncbi:hypothetical protein K452DRAFT_235944, partial [Aplosporella prunicola CBS 121167]
AKQQPKNKIQKAKTYNSWDSLVVTHLTTNQPVHSLCMAERTGCPVFYDLWSYVLIFFAKLSYIPQSTDALCIPVRSG